MDPFPPRQPPRDPMEEKKKEDDHLPSPVDSKVAIEKKKKKTKKKKKKIEDEHLPAPIDSNVVTTEKKKEKKKKKKKKTIEDEHFSSPTNSNVTKKKKKKRKEGEHFPSPVHSDVTAQPTPAREPLSPPIAIPITEAITPTNTVRVETGNRNVPSEHEIPTVEAFCINPSSLELLSEMGFTTNVSQMALRAVGGSDTEAAMDWIFDHQNEQDDTGFTTTTALPEEPLEVTVEGTNESRVLQCVPINELPLRCQRLLAEPSETRAKYRRQRPQDINIVANDSIEYIRGYIPSLTLPCSFFLFSLAFLVPLILFAAPSGHPIGIIFLLIAIFLSMISFFYIIRAQILRKPLRATDSQGIRKPYPGDWNGGVYLVGNVGFLQYDPIKERGWWFPLQSIREVGIKKIRGSEGETYYAGKLLIQSPEATIKHVIFGLEQYKINFQRIVRWYRDCSAEYP